MSVIRNHFARLRLGALLLLTACGGGDGSPTTPQGPGGNPGGSIQEASAPALSATSVEMMRGLGLSGLPSGRDDFIVEVAAPGTSVPDSVGDFILPLLPLDDGTYRVSIPIHPTDSTDGGEVELRVRDDADFVTRPATVTLDALPAAPGAFVELLDSLQAMLDLRFAEAGTTAGDVLAADWSTGLDPELLPFAIAQTLIDDPANSASLRALADGSDAFAPWFGSGSFDRDLLDRYTAVGGAQDAVNASLTALRSAGPSPVSGFGPQQAGSMSAAELDRQMEEAWAAAREIDPNSATGELLAAYGLGLGAAGVVAGPAGAVAAAGLGAALWAYQTYLEGKSKLLPRQFVPGSLLFDLSISEFEEDRPGPATWSNVRVSAQSEGWSVEKAAVDLLLQLAGGARAFGSWATKVADKVPTSVDALYFVRDQGLSRAAANADGLITIAPEVWLDVDISGSTWSEARLGPGNAITLAGTDQYNPINAGQQLLTVSTNPGRFGDATPVFHRETVEVKPIEVQVIPSKTTVKPNELIDFQILVSNFVSDELSWTLSGGVWSEAPNRIGEGTWSAQAQMPPDGFPVTVTFKSEATGGARDTPGAPPREGTAVLRNVTVVVDPPQKIMRKGDTQHFVASVVGTTNQNVTWSVSGPAAASMGSNGSFTAPDVLGDYVVTATSDEDPSAEGYANVTVVGECYYSITIGGETFTGDEISHVFGSGQLAATVSWTPANGAGFMYPESLVSGVTGPVPTSFAFQVGGRSWVATPDASDGTEATLSVVENTGDAVVGEVTGTVVTIVNLQEVYEPLLMEFRSLSVFGSSECKP